MQAEARETVTEIRERWAKAQVREHLIAAWDLAVRPVDGIQREELERRLAVILYHVGEALVMIAQWRDR